MSAAAATATRARKHTHLLRMLSLKGLHLLRMLTL
jgi:hypothetical protein